MSHWAEIDSNNVVLRVTVGDDSEGEAAAYQWLLDNLGGTWIQCSYNARIRGCFPGIGFRYDPVADVFIPPETEA